MRVTGDENSYKFPSWSPNSQELVYTSIFNTNVWVTSPFNPQPLEIPVGVSAIQAVWSPTSNSVAIHGRAGDDANIYLLEVETRALVNLTSDNLDYDGKPLWSPDGTEIAFETWRGESSSIFVVDVDGNNLRNVTQGIDGTKFLSDWSPDGRRLSFNVLREAHENVWTSHIWTVNTDGTDARNLTETFTCN